MRHRRGLNRIGVLAVALIIALGATGVAYGAWVDEITVEGHLSTSGINASLDCGECSLVGDPGDTGTYISCSAPMTPTTPMTLNLYIYNAQQEIDYYCEFTVSNAADSLPIKIASMPITDYTGVTAVITSGVGDLQVGDVIDPGQSATGKVHIYLTSVERVGQTLPFTLTVNVVRWNE